MPGSNSSPKTKSQSNRKGGRDDLSSVQRTEVKDSKHMLYDGSGDAGMLARLSPYALRCLGLDPFAASTRAGANLRENLAS